MSRAALTVAQLRELLAGLDDASPVYLATASDYAFPLVSVSARVPVSVSDVEGGREIDPEGPSVLVVTLEVSK